MPDIRLESLRCVYSAGTPFEKVALDNIDLTIPTGQYAALLGDMVYGTGKPEKGLEGQCLHARTLKFVHPRTGEHVELTSPLPEYFTQVLSRLGAPVDPGE